MRKLIAALVAGAALASSANAVVYTLNFEGLGNQDDILNFYNGGTSFQGFSGPNFGIPFVTGSLSLIDADAGGTGNFANEPSPSTILFFLDAGAAIMNVPAGFDTGFATWYTSISAAGSIDIYAGLNGTGALLASIPLVPLGSAGTPDPTGDFDTWRLVGTNFAGIAKSVVYGGVANQIGFDDVTFGSNIPEPTSLSLLALGGLALAFRRR